MVNIWVYKISLMIHIFSVFMWLATLPIGILLRRVITNLDSIEKVKEMASYAKITMILGTAGMIGILLSGGTMTGDNWFTFGNNYVWLSIKQVLFFLAIPFALIFMRQASANLTDVVNGDGSTKEDVITAFRGAEMRSHMLSTVVFVNIILATLKPF